MKKRIAFVVGVVILLVVIGEMYLSEKHTVQHQVVQKKVTETRTPALQKFSGIPTKYIGILPCAGCSGLKTQLTLYRKTPSDSAGLYDLQTTEMGTNGKPTDIQGKWKTIIGDKTNPKALVFEIQPDNSSDIRYFVKVDENAISLLSKQMVEIKSSNYILSKQ